MFPVDVDAARRRQVRVTLDAIDAIVAVERRNGRVYLDDAEYARWRAATAERIDAIVATIDAPIH